MMTVRRAVAGDESIVRGLRLEALAESPDAFTSTYAREAARTPEEWRRWLSTGATLVLEVHGIARGLVVGMHDASEPGVVLLLSMWVHPDLRGSGGADALVNEHLAWARAEQARLVRLAVMASNHRARRFYDRHGFRPTGRLTTREQDGHEAVEMERPVDLQATMAAHGRDAIGEEAGRWHSRT